ncbi:MAG: hypothetical protein DRO11_10175 [Methanobacteriota archaeon]|nr:MAG: hypothetical protein DRO11_10175 [Euryarchaeota archaeon]
MLNFQERCVLARVAAGRETKARLKALIEAEREIERSPKERRRARKARRLSVKKRRLEQTR